MKKLTILLTALLATMTVSSCDLWSEADIVKVDTLDSPDRGGFGSTGTN